jgi:hypothetical protein
MAICPRDGAPLISTLAFRKAEFYCLDCGGHFGFLSPDAAEDTPELRARYEALKSEWDEHAGSKLLADGGWYEDCERCEPGGEPHTAHAAAEELAAHEAALTWLRERAAS